MDKATLTKEQLVELKNYIQKRGFREPIIVMEILDHFACVVEEKIQADTKLSFEEAMREAHKSFGVRGFKALADAADLERNKRFTRMFKQKLRGLLFNPVNVLILLLFSTFLYKMYHLAMGYQYGWFSGSYIVSAVYLSIYIAGMTLINKQVPDRKIRYSSGYMSLTDNGYSWALFVGFATFPHVNYMATIWPFALFATVLTTYLLLFLIVQYRAIIAMVKHNTHVLEAYAELDS